MFRGVVSHLLQNHNHGIGFGVVFFHLLQNLNNCNGCGVGLFHLLPNYSNCIGFGVFVFYIRFEIIVIVIVSGCSFHLLQKHSNFALM